MHTLGHCLFFSRHHLPSSGDIRNHLFGAGSAFLASTDTIPAKHFSYGGEPTNPRRIPLYFFPCRRALQSRTAVHHRTTHTHAHPPILTKAMQNSFSQ